MVSLWRKGKANWSCSSHSRLEKGNVVSIASEGNPEWLYTDMGTIGAGGISVECIQQTWLHRLSI